VWLAATVEDNKRRPRILDLLSARWPAVHFLSMEPLLEAVSIVSAFPVEGPQVSWVITGDESGPGRRPTDLDWIRMLREQCSAARIAFFYKQRVLPSGVKIERPVLDGRVWNQVPTPFPRENHG